ncbi:DUF1643 domain-containing protein [Herbiconiux sp. P16]|uniref:DUF1643 domain-containing protein n=1 Tax=Herbiconiux wuyangfengii TaxID=3342794 RepID=UPI0035B7881B
MGAFASDTTDIRGDYRYSLTRVRDPTSPNITFVLLYPSTADADQLDPTLRRCVTFAKREGFGGMVILNLYAFRTKPKVMLAAGDPVGPDNDRILASATGTVVAGWGAKAAPARVAEALALLPRLHVLGLTKDGHPWHPLYVRAGAPLVGWARTCLQIMGRIAGPQSEMPCSLWQQATRQRTSDSWFRVIRRTGRRPRTRRHQPAR